MEQITIDTKRRRRNVAKQTRRKRQRQTLAIVVHVVAIIFGAVCAWFVAEAILRRLGVDLSSVW